MLDKQTIVKRIACAGIWILIFCLNVQGQESNLWKFRILLSDKAATEHSLDRPEDFLSSKAIERRKRQSLPIDSTDLPVCRLYLNRILEQKVELLCLGKWDNFVTVASRDSAIVTDLQALPFVRKVICVWKGKSDYGKERCLTRMKLGLPTDERKTEKRKKIRRKATESPEDTSLYGAGEEQITLCNGHKLHQQGFRGKGMTIAIIDAGFHNADRMDLRESIAGAHDFVQPATEDIYAEHEHGMNVLSCMAANRPHELVGTAPEASYWLLRSEDLYSEQAIEQDFWAAALEFADSIGADVVNTSLGYTHYDNDLVQLNYTNLDGKTHLMSRQASKAASKGMILLCSAGNEGGGSWKKLSIPADADAILTVGAVDCSGKLGYFSSVGNTYDGRVKPDVVAPGVQTAVLGMDGTVVRKNGTSFSSPVLCGLIACLWQAIPDFSAEQIIKLVRNSGDRAEHPDNIYGYGIPDLWKAYQTAKACKKP